MGLLPQLARGAARGGDGRAVGGGVEGVESGQLDTLACGAGVGRGWAGVEEEGGGTGSQGPGQAGRRSAPMAAGDPTARATALGMCRAPDCGPRAHRTAAPCTRTPRQSLPTRRGCPGARAPGRWRGGGGWVTSGRRVGDVWVTCGCAGAWRAACWDGAGAAPAAPRQSTSLPRPESLAGLPPHPTPPHPTPPHPTPGLPPRACRWNAALPSGPGCTRSLCTRPRTLTAMTGLARGMRGASSAPGPRDSRQSRA
jgi:hypothetical protein